MYDYKNSQEWKSSYYEAILNAKHVSLRVINVTNRVISKYPKRPHFENYLNYSTLVNDKNMVNVVLHVLQNNT